MDNLELKNIVIIEGFDKVGKTTYIDKNPEIFKDYQVYYADHNLTDETVGRVNSWTIGYSIIDLYSKINNAPKLIINRGIFSSYVYSKLYSNVEIPEKVIEWYSKNEYFKNNVSVIYVCHKNKNSAKLIYENSESRELNPNLLSAKYDRFKSFEDYWNIYTLFDNCYTEIFNRLGIVPIKVNPSTDNLGNFKWDVVL